MDYSKYIQMKQKAANVYKSNWQARDASEVTLRNAAISNKPNSTVHQGPDNVCGSGSSNTSVPATPSQAPGNGFSTDYSMDIVSNQRAGCASCQDVAWGTAGGVQFRTCAEVTLFTTPPSNPMKGTNLTIPDTDSIITPPCVSRNDPGVVQRGFTNCSTVTPAYTGSRNQVPTSGNGQKPLQQYPYPSA
jgi:hypothetical protein